MDKKPAIKTFFKFLQEGYTVAQLATTVESKGVHGWDRFGRFRSHPKGSAGAMEALDALAEFHDKELQFVEDLEKDLPKDAEDMALRPYPFDEALEHPNNGVFRFGWPEGQVPEINRSEVHPLPPRKARTADPRKTNIVLGALLECLRDFRESGKTMKIPAEDRLNDLMIQRFQHVSFIRRSTIQNEFATAKEIVRKAQEQAQGGG